MNNKLGKPRLVICPGEKSYWEVDMPCRCPACKKIFSTTNSAYTAYGSLFTACGPTDKDGFYRIECSIACMDDETKNKLERTRLKFCEDNGYDEKTVKWQ